MASVLVGQLELMTPPPRRKIIVPPGHTAVWGVDPSTRRIAVAGVEVSGIRWVQTTPFMQLGGASRLAEIHGETLVFALGQREASHPGLIFVEQPSGKVDNPNLLYAVGVVQAALAEACPKATVETVTSSWWKARACGKGNIYKPKHRGDEYGVLTWARENGYVGSSWDEADAWGIAEAARREVLLEER